MGSGRVLDVARVFHRGSGRVFPAKILRDFTSRPATQDACGTTPESPGRRCGSFRAGSLRVLIEKTLPDPLCIVETLPDPLTAVYDPHTALLRTTITFFIV